jgi:hypothetical protein
MVFKVFFWERLVYDLGLRKSGGEFVRSIYAIYFMKGQKAVFPAALVSRFEIV